MSSTNYLKYLIFALLIAVLSSCSVEYKLADDFAKNKNKGAVLVLAPETVFTSNLKDSLIIKHPYLSQSQKDTLLQMSNFYLKYIDERNFVDNSLSFLKDELTKMGFQVYDENSFDQFMQTKDSSYVFKLSQVELEEGYGERIQTQYHYDEPLDVTVRVNYVNISYWFELERKNVTDETFPLLYASYSLMDGLQGAFLYNEKGKLNYTYNVDTLKVKDFKEIPELLGKKYAGYFYDYVLNISILESLPADKAPTYYFHFDPRAKSISPLQIENDLFIEIMK